MGIVDIFNDIRKKFIKSQDVDELVSKVRELFSDYLRDYVPAENQVECRNAYLAVEGIAKREKYTKLSQLIKGIKKEYSQKEKAEAEKLYNKILPPLIAGYIKESYIKVIEVFDEKNQVKFNLMETVAEKIKKDAYYTRDQIYKFIDGVEKRLDLRLEEDSFARLQALKRSIKSDKVLK